jgi:hypothetical protein
VRITTHLNGGAACPAVGYETLLGCVFIYQIVFTLYCGIFESVVTIVKLFSVA